MKLKCFLDLRSGFYGEYFVCVGLEIFLKFCFVFR